ncbi:MAG: hypothetical protein DMG30_06010 [Acidobacteria bacterium]|nr:MAG: hypothetical protein DMG30_06010 [Acidobacteriota bacterium]
MVRQNSVLTVGTIQLELDLLSQLGLIERSTVGKQVFYRANCSHLVPTNSAMGLVFLETWIMHRFRLI